MSERKFQKSTNSQCIIDFYFLLIFIIYLWIVWFCIYLSICLICRSKGFVLLTVGTQHQVMATTWCPLLASIDTIWICCFLCEDNSNISFMPYQFHQWYLADFGAVYFKYMFWCLIIIPIYFRALRRFQIKTLLIRFNRLCATICVYKH